MKVKEALGHTADPRLEHREHGCVWSLLRCRRARRCPGNKRRHGKGARRPKESAPKVQSWDKLSSNSSDTILAYDPKYKKYK